MKGAATAAIKDSLFVFGGYGQEHRPLDVFLQVDTGGKQVKAIDCKEKPAARAYSKLAVLNPGMLALLGGIGSLEFTEPEYLFDLNIFDIAHQVWFKPMVGGETPALPSHFGMDSNCQGQLLVFGGSEKQPFAWLLLELEDEECYAQEEGVEVVTAHKKAGNDRSIEEIISG